MSESKRGKDTVATPPKPLMNAKELLEKLFAPGSRPSVRWLRDQTKKGLIPFKKVSNLVFYDEDQVRAVLTGKEKK